MFLDSLDYTIVDNKSQLLGIENLEMIREYTLDKRDGEYNHVDMLQLPYNLQQINYITENNFKFIDDEIEAEYIKLRKQLINWFFNVILKMKLATMMLILLNNHICYHINGCKSNTHL